MGGMKLADVAWIVSEPGRSWAFDHFPTREAAQDCADREELKTGPRYNVEDFDTFHERTTREQLEASPLVEITADFYDAQHGCLPPMHRPGAWGWFMCEYSSGSLTQQFVTRGGRYYTALVDMANRATWITPDGSPVFAWYGAEAMAPREIERFIWERAKRPEPAARVAYLGDLMEWGEPASLGARLEGF